MKKILVTGGAGAIGTPLLEFLCSQVDYQIVVFDLFSRATRKKLSRFEGKLELRFGDIRNLKEVEAVCEKVDIVIHLAAIIPPLADTNPELAYQVNVLGTENLIQALEKKSKHAFILYASSVSVYGDRISHPFIKVSDPLVPSVQDHYAETKIKAEEIIKTSKLDWSIFRLSAIFGTSNLKVNHLLFLMPLRTSIEFSTTEDAARAFYQAIDKKALLKNKVFNLGGGENCRISYEEFLTATFEISGLGAIDFPPQSFAEKNFHCGYYADGHKLEEILQFRRDTTESYLHRLEKTISPLQRKLTYLFRRPIKRYLLKLSDPYRAKRNKDIEELKRYFN